MTQAATDISGTPTSDLMVEMRGVNKWYGDFHVLRDIDLEVKRGERIVICGPSGSGKSTLIRCINHLEEHQQGDIVVGGVPLTQDVKRIEQIRRSVGMVFQHFNLFPHLTVLENCCIAPMWVQKPRREAEEMAMQYLERVRIAEQALKYRVSFPAASSSGSPLPAHCACTLTSCSSTNQRRPLTQK